MGKPFYQWTTQDIIERARQLDRPMKIKILAGGVGGIVFIIFVIWPAWFVRPQLKSRIADLKDQIQFSRAQIEEERALIDSKEGMSSFVQQTAVRLFRREETETIAGSIAEMAKRSGVTLVSLNPEGSGSSGIGVPAGDSITPVSPFEKKYEPLRFVLTAEGGYHELAAFVAEIENYEKLLRVVEFSVNSQEENPRVHTSEIRFWAFARGTVQT